jgi:hypothetical protein
MKYFLLYVYTTLSFVVIGDLSGLCAEDRDSLPKSEFFEKDFAKNPLQKQSDQEKRKHVLIDAFTKKEAEKTVEKLKSSSSVVSSQQEQSPLGPTVKRRVLSVSGIINGLTQDHLQNNIIDFYQTVSSKGFYAKKLYVISFPWIAPRILEFLMQKDQKQRYYFEAVNSLEVVKKVPEKYKEVKKSPAWIVEVEIFNNIDSNKSPMDQQSGSSAPSIGEVVIEGVSGSFEDMFDEYGLFNDKYR